jgi:hypothetical protein
MKFIILFALLVTIAHATYIDSPGGSYTIGYSFGINALTCGTIYPRLEPVSSVLGCETFLFHEYPKWMWQFYDIITVIPNQKWTARISYAPDGYALFYSNTTANSRTKGMCLGISAFRTTIERGPVPTYFRLSWSASGTFSLQVQILQLVFQAAPFLAPVSPNFPSMPDTPTTKRIGIDWSVPTQPMWDLFAQHHPLVSSPPGQNAYHVAFRFQYLDKGSTYAWGNRYLQTYRSNAQVTAQTNWNNKPSVTEVVNAGNNVDIPQPTWKDTSGYPEIILDTQTGTTDSRCFYFKFMFPDTGLIIGTSTTLMLIG